MKVGISNLVLVIKCLLFGVLSQPIFHIQGETQPSSPPKAPSQDSTPFTERKRTDRRPPRAPQSVFSTGAINPEPDAVREPLFEAIPQQRSIWDAPEDTMYIIHDIADNGQIYSIETTVPVTMRDLARSIGEYIMREARLLPRADGTVYWGIPSWPNILENLRNGTMNLHDLVGVNGGITAASADLGTVADLETHPPIDATGRQEPSNEDHVTSPAAPPQQEEAAMPSGEAQTNLGVNHPNDADGPVTMIDSDSVVAQGSAADSDILRGVEGAEVENANGMSVPNEHEALLLEQRIPGYNSRMDATPPDTSHEPSATRVFDLLGNRPESAEPPEGWEPTTPNISESRFVGEGNDRDLLAESDSLSADNGNMLQASESTEAAGSLSEDIVEGLEETLNMIPDL